MTLLEYFARTISQLGQGSNRGRRGDAEVGRNLREFSMYEGREGAVTSCRSLPENCRDMGDGRGCNVMPECIVEERRGEYESRDVRDAVCVGCGVSATL